MPIFATAGAKLYIGGPMEPNYSGDLDEDDFDTQTWVEITPLERLGSFGDSSEEITFNSINDSRVHKLKGSRNAGTMEITVGLDRSDPGQAALIAAEKTPNRYAFRIVFNDAPPGGTPSEALFIAIVMGVPQVLDEANSVMAMQASLSLDSNVVSIDRAEA